MVVPDHLVNQWIEEFSRFATDWFNVKKVSEASTQVKNFAIALRYDSRSGTHNMHREYRELEHTSMHAFEHHEQERVDDI